MVNAKNLYSGSTYTFMHHPTQAGKLFYRLKMIDIDKAFTFSPVVSVQIAKTAESFVSPTLIQNGMVHVFLQEKYQTLELVNISGNIVLLKNIGGRIGQVDVQLSNLSAGIYFVRLKNNTAVNTHKIFVQ